MAIEVELTLNTRMFDRFVRHRHRLERVKAGLQRKYLSLLPLSEIVSVLRSRLPRIRSRGSVAAIAGQKNYRALRDAVRRASSGAFASIRDRFVDDLRELAIRESRFVVRVLGEELEFDFSSVVPSRSRLRRIIREPIAGKTLTQWTQDISRATAGNTMREVNLGIVNGETTDQIVRRVTSRRGPLSQARREWSTIIDTAAGHSADGAQSVATDANRSVVREEQWSAILDSLTCPICAGLDGRRFPVNEGPRPPNDTHPACRCTRIPVIKGGGKLQDKPTYVQWLRRQPRSVQDEVLGPTRARLWRGGRITIDRMVDSRRRILTLDELDI